MACDVPFDPAMLAWAPGRRETDGVWAPAWYGSVETSTGFAPPRPEPTIDDLPDALKRLAEKARPLYETLAAHKLTVVGRKSSSPRKREPRDPVTWRDLRSPAFAGMT